MKRRFGPAAIVTIGGLVTATACGLFIDPDKLIADNGDLDDAAAPNRDVNVDDSGGEPVDAGVDAPPLSVVPACVPPAPAGAKGPYAVLLAQTKTPSACPEGYLATAAATGKTDLNRPLATCGTAGCSCTMTEDASCPRTVSYFSDGFCKIPSGDPSEVLTGCVNLPKGAFDIKVDLSAKSPTCQPAGTTSPTSKPAAVYATTIVACESDPAVMRAPCDAGQVALSPVNALTCVLLSGVSKCPAPYVAAYPISTTGNVNDTRGCSCTCPASGATTCTGTGFLVFGGTGCGGGTADSGFGICLPRGGADSISGEPPLPSGYTSCTPGSNVTGDVQPINDMTLCCLR